MTYNPNIPQGTDNLSTSQGQMLTNFGQLNTQFTKNHKAYNDATYPGLHTKIDFPVVLGSDPTLTGAGQGTCIYPKLDSNSTAQAFFRNAASILQLTNLPVATNSPSGGTAYSIVTPWGLKISYGNITITAKGLNSSVNSINVTFPTAFTTGVYSVQVTSNLDHPASAIVGVSGVTTTTLPIYAQSSTSLTVGPFKVFFFAIGV